MVIWLMAGSSELSVINSRAEDAEFLGTVLDKLLAFAANKLNADPGLQML